MACYDHIAGYRYRRARRRSCALLGGADRLLHVNSGKSIVLRQNERAVILDDSLGSAAIRFGGSELPLPETILPLLEKDNFIAPGVEIGWLGFPAIPQAGLCFFSGGISAYLWIV